MIINRRTLLKAGAAGLATAGIAGLPGAVFAQDKYPSRPIRLVLGFAPGGPSDVTARRFADKLRQEIGQSIVVENRDGGGGSIAASDVARSKPDGYTVMWANGSTHVLAPLTLKAATYDPVKDFAHVRLLVRTPLAIAVHPDVPAKNLREYADLIKANPDKYFFATGGIGGGPHLTGELFKKIAGGLKMEHVSYKGGAPAMQDVVAGRVSTLIEVMAGLVNFHKAGQIRILAVLSEERLAIAPDIPTAVESGFPGFVSDTFLGIVAASRTPPAIVATLSDAIGRTVNDPEVRTMLENEGRIPQLRSTPADMTKLIQGELAKWGPIVTDLGLGR